MKLHAMIPERHRVLSELAEINSGLYIVAVTDGLRDSLTASATLFSDTRDARCRPGAAPASLAVILALGGVAVKRRK